MNDHNPTREVEASEQVSLLVSDLIEDDDYDVPGSTFFRCRICQGESGAGLLNKGIQHATECPLADALATRAPLPEVDAAVVLPTPPAAWDEYAMKAAGDLYGKIMAYTYLRGNAAIHVALVDAMRFAAERQPRAQQPTLT